MLKIKSLGICFGASSLKVFELIKENNIIKCGKFSITKVQSLYLNTVYKVLNNLNREEYKYCTITGRNLKHKISLASINELEAVENALEFFKTQNRLNFNINAIISLGAENFILYHFNESGNIYKAEAENKCASGTGDFFLQQISRLNLSLDEAINIGKNYEPYEISGRCAVYCKSDCTHALNKGIPINNVVAGLHKMMANKILYLLEKVEKNNIILIGGVTKNSTLIDILKKEIDNLYIPDEAIYFEALGAAYYAIKNKKKFIKKNLDYQNQMSHQYHFLPPIQQKKELVKFHSRKFEKANENDECIIGIDAGSTTTKSVVIRVKDNAILTSVYLRTNGDPVNASRECYSLMDKQIKKKINIIGLGVTGSGSRIVGLHAGTEGIINEIISHAAGSVYFDKDVETIFEIGGQDAKYIYLLNGIPVDNAMNESCAAGTGSFLEEAIKNNFSINYFDLEIYAFRSKNPPNFSDQCSAFINSDIKNAIQENIPRDDIIAGIIYSICFNYLNKVKSQRSIGKKVFMQGGVCYNKAVPYAMANLLNKEIIVPPEPGLIGAFGVALEIKNRIQNGLLFKKKFNLKKLAETEIEYGKSFICRQDSSCDRKCNINILIINGKKYPFGGACDRYYNKTYNIKGDFQKNNFIKIRENFIFNQYNKNILNKNSKKIGINKSFYTHLLYPLFFFYFQKIGLETFLSDKIDPEGFKNKNCSFCYPLEISHGYFSNLLKKNLDYIFSPKIVELYVENSVSYDKEHQCTCLISQSEAYILKSAFREKIKSVNFISPEINFSQGYESQGEVFINIAKQLGKSKEEAIDAYEFALQKQNDFFSKLKSTGNKILKELENTDKIGIVIFGRPYNAMAKEINLGIPDKLASRGYVVIPWDFLPIENEYCNKDMNWAMGQNIIKAAYFVEKNPNLFGLYITNFSCGPDSFLIGSFRDIMGKKPSLTLEIDSHTTDTGINTRIEAFFDIIDRYIKIQKVKIIDKNTFNQAKIIFKGNKPIYISSEQTEYGLFDKNVHLLIPSIGEYSSEILAAAFNSVGINASALPPYDVESFKLGKENTIGKECLPLILVVGGFLKYLKYNRNNKEKIALFLPSNPGNFRFSQYSIFLNDLIKKNKIKNICLLSLAPENSYAGIPIKGMLCFLKGVIIADIMEDIKNTVKALAKNKNKAFKILNTEWVRIKEFIKINGAKDLYKLLEEVANNLKKIELKIPLHKAKKVCLSGDFFARRDDFCCQNLIDRLAEKEIVVKREHIFGWFIYVDYLLKNKIIQTNFNFKGKIEFFVKRFLENSYEKKIKKIFLKSGLCEYELVNIEEIMEYGRKYFDKNYTGEQVLVIGNFFKDILSNVHGVISIGPFACMPMKIVEAILSKDSTINIKKAFQKDKLNYDKYNNLINLPFLHIEVDGNPFSQITEIKLEAFLLQIDRVYNIK